MKRASKYFYIFGGVFCLVSIISILVFAFLLFVGGFVPALVLGIIDIPYAISEGHTPYAFLEIGLPINNIRPSVFVYRHDSRFR